MIQKEYYKGNIGKFMSYIAGAFKLDPAFLKASLISNFPELKDPSQCANCGANMEMRIFTANILTALLLIAMAKQVKQNMAKGMNFTEANRVHLPTLQASDAVRHASTIAYYLGFVVQPGEWAKSGYWLITKWGWKALRGEPVPAQATMFRGELKERSTQMITLAEMFQSHIDKVERAIARKKAVDNDFRADIRSYNPIEWTEFGGYGDGKLF